MPLGLLGKNSGWWDPGSSMYGCLGWYWRQVSAAGCPESAHGVMLYVEYEANKKEKQVEKGRRK